MFQLAGVDHNRCCLRRRVRASETLDVILNSAHTFDDHISRVILANNITATWVLRHIGDRSLAWDAPNTIAISTVNSDLNYSNSNVYGAAEKRRNICSVHRTNSHDRSCLFAVAYLSRSRPFVSRYYNASYHGK